jgi:hypothetical protein
MANRAYLVGSSNDTPACTFADELSYEPDTDVLCASSYLVPVFWLTLFASEDLKMYVRDDLSIPAPVTTMVEARGRLLDREAVVLGRFSDFRTEWQEFEALIADASGSFLKLDCAELWDMEPEQITTRLKEALCFWSSGKNEGWNAVLSLAVIKEKSFLRGYSFQPDTKPAAQMQGYGWVRPVPWKD